MSQQLVQSRGHSTRSSSSSNSSRPSCDLISTKQSSTCMRLLSKAVSTRKLPALKEYVSKNGNVNAIVYLGMTTQRWFLSQSDSLSAEGLQSSCLLSFYALENQKPHVLALLHAKAVIDGHSGSLFPLAAAASRGHTDMMTLLISRGASISHDTGRGTAFMAACYAGQLVSAQLLLAAGADPAAVREF